MNLLVGVFCIPRGGLVETAMEPGSKPDPSVTSLLMCN